MRKIISLIIVILLISFNSVLASSNVQINSNIASENEITLNEAFDTEKSLFEKIQANSVIHKEYNALENTSNELEEEVADDVAGNVEEPILKNNRQNENIVVDTSQQQSDINILTTQDITQVAENSNKNIEVKEENENFKDNAIVIIEKNDINQSLYANDKRRYIRFKNDKIQTPVIIKFSQNNEHLIDISRGGIAFKNNNDYAIGELIPIQICYKDIIINTKIKVLNSNNNRTSAEFIPEQNEIENKLLYLSVRLEADNKMLATRFR